MHMSGNMCVCERTAEGVTYLYLHVINGSLHQHRIAERARITVSIDKPNGVCFRIYHQVSVLESGTPCDP